MLVIQRWCKIKMHVHVYSSYMYIKHCKWFEPRCISSWYSVTVRVRVVLRMLLVTDVSITCADLIFRFSESTLKMTSAQVVEMSATNNSSSQNYSHLDNHTIRTTLNIVNIFYHKINHINFCLHLQVQCISCTCRTVLFLLLILFVLHLCT